MKGKKMILKYRNFPDMEMSLPFDWSVDPYSNNNWCHNFYSLRWLPSNIKQWVRDGKVGVNPVLFFVDFLTYHANEDKPKNRFYMSKLADHSMSERLEVFAHFIKEKQNENPDYEQVDTKILEAEIKKHIEVLLGDRVYRKKSNHGFMIDLALIEFSLVLPKFDEDSHIITIAEKRIAEQMEAMFDTFGFNKEHSISYQEFDAALCIQLWDLYQKYKRETSLLSKIYTIIATTHHFLKYCVKPNGENHRIGDTFAYPNERLLHKIEQAYQKLPSQIKKRSESFFGENLASTLLIAPEAGFSVIRNKYGESKEKIFHLFFTASWHSYVHKQNDDLSFSLYSNGCNIIEDPGYSDVITRDEVPYASEEVHNVSTCENHKWKNRNAPLKDTKLTKYFQSDSLLAIQGVQHRMQNIYVERTLIYVKPQILIVVDHYESALNEEFLIQTRFNFGLEINEFSEIAHGMSFLVNNQPKKIQQIRADSLIEQKMAESFMLNRDGTISQSKAVHFFNRVNAQSTVYTLIDLSENENFEVDVQRQSSSEITIDVTKGNNTNRFELHLEHTGIAPYCNSRFMSTPTVERQVDFIDSDKKEDEPLQESGGVLFFDCYSYAKFPTIRFESADKWKLIIHFLEYENDANLNFFFGERGSRFHGFARVKNKIMYRLADGSYIGGLPYNVGNFIRLTVTYDDGAWLFTDGEKSVEVQQKTDVVFNAIGSGFTGYEHEEKTSISYVGIQEYSETDHAYKDVGIWKLNENRGCIAFDSSGTQRHAVLTNTKWHDSTINELILGSYPLAQEDWQQYTHSKPSRKFEFLDEAYNKEKDLFLWTGIEAGLNDKNWDKGKKLLENIYSFDRFEPVHLSTVLTWKENPLSNRSWQWQFHQLIFYIDLLAAHTKTKEAKYLDRLVEILTSWYDCNYAEEHPSEMSWHDHTTALRLRSLIYIWEYLRNSEYAITEDFASILLNLVETHCNVLSVEKFYMKHNNHGFDQSLFLYLASVKFPEFENAKQWHDIAFDRLVDEVGIAFTSEGIHVENSPSYLVGMIQRVDLASKMIQHYEPGNSIELNDIINNALKALAYLVHPNGALPMFGDTDPGTRIPALNHLKNNTNFQLFQYVHSQAQRGKVGENLPDAVFEESGYAVLRDKWHEKDTYDDMTHLVFKCGFLSTFHRHDDDLNFILHGLGEEWFVDGGIYKYNEQDPYRKYLRSAKAHNIPVVPNAEVSRIINKDADKQSKITDYFLNEETSWVAAKSFMYTGYCVTRRIEYIRPNRFIITDKVDADTKEVTPYELMFHIPMDKKIEIRDDNSVYISGQNSHELHMLFDGECTYSFELLSGEDNEEVIGWQSKVFGKIDAIQTLRCSIVPKHNKGYSIVEMTLRK
ncbi:heparinase II/III family protein [Sulfurimonas sp. HSL3-7]|uniref:heparinase II/III family protein n=1 Tax=Sulfonitrofixus jiaomeiensis TaxID=3131938 RepID=UPI0031F7E0BF